jgi:CTP:molybdopterin cytidylyltransferase MocA
MTSAILLAAGESTRMGRPKPLLPWGDTTLIEYQIAELRAAGVDDVVVVLGHDADEMRSHVPQGARAVVNMAYRQGRASSLRAGAAALPDSANPIVVLNVDQPRPRSITQHLLKSHADAGALITLPAGDGKRGHPVVLSGALLPELREATEEAKGLHGVLDAHAGAINVVHYMLVTHESAVGDPDWSALIVTLDLNTQNDYEQALSLFGIANT